VNERRNEGTCCAVYSALGQSDTDTPLEMISSCSTQPTSMSTDQHSNSTDGHQTSRPDTADNEPSSDVTLGLVDRQRSSKLLSSALKPPHIKVDDDCF